MDTIVFRREFRDACAQNRCGKFGKNWMCPPDAGDIDEMIARAKRYGGAVVFQTIGALEDSYDVEGMHEAAKKHSAMMQALAARLGDIAKDYLILGAGGCNICARCAKMDDLPCVHPDQAIASLEAYGIAVSELAAACSLNYSNGANTVTFFGGILY